MFIGHNIMGNCQSLTAAFAHLLGGKKWFENLTANFIAHASTVITNLYLHILLICRCTYSDLPFRTIIRQIVGNGMGSIDNDIEKYLAYFITFAWRHR